MKQLLFLFVCIFFAVSAIGQKYNESPPPKDSILGAPILQYRIDYPIGVNGETFFNGRMEYKISEKLTSQLESFYAKFGTHEEIGSSFSFKWYVQKKMYLFAGTQVQYDLNQNSGSSELLRVNLNFGVGYEVNPNFLLELGYHPLIGKPKTNLNASPQSKQNSFSFRAKF